MANQDYDAACSEFAGSKGATGECPLCHADIFGNGKDMIVSDQYGTERLHVCVDCYEHYREISE